VRSTAKPTINLIAGATGSASGISRYCQELYKGLQGRAHVRLCSFRSPPLANRLTFLEHLPVGVEPDEGGGIYHFTRIMGCALMLWRPLHPAVATVHDLGPLLWPPERREADALSWRLFRLSLEGLKRMDHIVAVSQYTARSIADLLGVPAERITVVHEGVDGQLFRPTPGARETLQARYGIPDATGLCNLLYVGSEAPRKNLGTLLEALALLRAGGAPARLIKVGHGGSARHRAAFEAQIARLGLAGNVVIVDEAPDADLALFYSAADVYVQPSYVEGFGLPVLEAMACGTPVVCSNAGALPEVAGEAGLLVEPGDAKGFADAITAVLSDTALRRGMVAKGWSRAQAFSWNDVATQMMGIYSTLHERIGK